MADQKNGLKLPDLPPIQDAEIVLVARVGEDLEELWDKVRYIRGKAGQIVSHLRQVGTNLSKQETEHMQREILKLTEEQRYRAEEFWYKTKLRYDLWDHDSIGIRQRYCIVRTKRQSPPTIIIGALPGY